MGLASIPLLLCLPLSGSRPYQLSPAELSRCRRPVRLCAAAFPLHESRPSGDRVQYVLDQATDTLLHKEERPVSQKYTTALTASGKTLKQRLQRFLATIFLPAGYPQSVAPEYLKFQGWNIIQDLSTYLRGILATQAILEGVGVGKADATPLAATLQWITRDGASMISGLVFTSLVSTNFGTNVKVWRLFGDIIVDVGITLEMLAPLFPKQFLLCICLASVCKALCGIAAGSANGAIVEHWARNNNIADVLAKGGAQHTAVSLLGLGFGMWFARVANANALRIWVAYISLTVIHLAANYAAMKVLALRSINRSRLEVLLSDYEAHGPSEPSRYTPSVIGRQESVLPWLAALNPLNLFRARRAKIRMGVRLKDLVGSKASYLSMLSEVFQGEKFLVSRAGRDVVVALEEGASGLDQIKAYMQARSLAARATRGSEQRPPLRQELQESLKEAREGFEGVQALLQSQGWDLNRVLLETEGWQYSK